METLNVASLFMSVETCKLNVYGPSRPLRTALLELLGPKRHVIAADHQKCDWRFGLALQIGKEETQTLESILGSGGNPRVHATEARGVV
jgi:hypothetical protein